MAKALFIWLMLIYTCIALYSVYFALTLKAGEEANLTTIHRIMYKHGTYFVAGVIAAAVLSLAGIGVWAVVEQF